MTDRRHSIAEDNLTREDVRELEVDARLGFDVGLAGASTECARGAPVHEPTHTIAAADGEPAILCAEVGNGPIHQSVDARQAV